MCLGCNPDASWQQVKDIRYLPQQSRFIVWCNRTFEGVMWHAVFPERVVRHCKSGTCTLYMPYPPEQPIITPAACRNSSRLRLQMTGISGRYGQVADTKRSVACKQDATVVDAHCIRHTKLLLTDQQAIGDTPGGMPAANALCR